MAKTLFEIALDFNPHIFLSGDFKELDSDFETHKRYYASTMCRYINVYIESNGLNCVEAKISSNNKILFCIHDMWFEYNKGFAKDVLWSGNFTNKRVKKCIYAVLGEEDLSLLDKSISEAYELFNKNQNKRTR